MTAHHCRGIRFSTSATCMTARAVGDHFRYNRIVIFNAPCENILESGENASLDIVGVRPNEVVL